MHYLVNRASVFFSRCLVSLEALYLITVHISQISLTLPHSTTTTSSNSSSSRSSSNGDPFVNSLPVCSGVCCKCQLQVAVPHIIIIIGRGSYIMLIIHFTLNDSPALSLSSPHPLSLSPFFCCLGKVLQLTSFCDFYSETFSQKIPATKGNELK